MPVPRRRKVGTEALAHVDEGRRRYPDDVRRRPGTGTGIDGADAVRVSIQSRFKGHRPGVTRTEELRCLEHDRSLPIRRRSPCVPRRSPPVRIVSLAQQAAARSNASAALWVRELRSRRRSMAPGATAVGEATSSTGSPTAAAHRDGFGDTEAHRVAAARMRQLTFYQTDQWAARRHRQGFVFSRIRRAMRSAGYYRAAAQRVSSPRNFITAPGWPRRQRVAFYGNDATRSVTTCTLPM